MRVVYDPTRLLPIATASSSSGATTANNAIDGDPTTYWESNSETNPWILVDLTKTLRVYQIDITFDSVNVPSSFNILSSDNPNETEYGTFSGAFDLVQSVASPISNSKNIYFVPSRSTSEFRYLQVQMVGTGQMRIKEIAVWAATTTPGTTSRIKISPPGATPTYFTPQTHDLLEIHLHEGPVSDKINELDFRLSNKNEKYLQSNYPLGSRTLFWIDGVQKLFGTLTLFTPHYDSSGFVIDGQAKDFGDFLINQTVRQSWAALTPFDSTQPNDIIATGPNSILAQITTSAGSRLFTGGPSGYPNLSSTLASPNFIPYFKSQNKDAWSLLKDLKVQAIDGAWGVQNGLFNQAQTLATSTTVPNTISDGYWFAYTNTVTSAGFNNSLVGNVTTLDITSVVVNVNTLIAVENNDPEAFYANVLSKYTTGIYDGGTAAESQYAYSELYQPLIFLVSQLDPTNAASISVTDALTPKSSTYNPVSALGTTQASGVWDIIVEGVALNGRVRRLHYITANVIFTAKDGTTLTQQSFWDTTGALTFTGLPDKLATKGSDSQDAYLTPSPHIYVVASGDFATSPFSWNSNLYNDWISKFGSASTTDTITTVRARALSFIDSTQAGNGNLQNARGLQITTLNISLPSSVKNPPQQFDFLVSSTTSSGVLVPDLQWFSKPRLGIDLGRNLDDTNMIRFYSDFPRSDLNNLISFEVMSDSYPVKNEASTVGTPSYVLPDKTYINARDPNYIIGFPPWHGSATPKIDISSQANMTALGRRKIGKDISGTIQDAAKDAIDTLNANLNIVQRVVIKVRGNANITPGQVIFLDGSFVAPQGYWYIVSVLHDWTIQGYTTEITASADRLRFSTELVRLQQQIFKSALIGGSTQPNQNLQTITFGKFGADMDGIELTSNPEGSPVVGQPSLRLPFNLIPEFSHITHVTATTTRLEGPLVNGTFVANGNAGWDLVNKINHGGTGGADFQLRDDNWLGQRFQMTSQSAGRVKVEFQSYLDSPPTPGQSLLVTLYTDTTKASSGPIPQNIFLILGIQGMFALGGAILGALNVGIPARPDTTGQSIIIPFSKLPQNSLNTTQAEFDLASPLLPNTFFWVALSTISTGASRVHIGVSTAGSYDGQPTATGSQSGWTTNSPGYNMTSAVYPQLAMNSAGATGYGGGNMLTMWDSLGQGNAFQAQSPTGAAQSFSQVDIITSMIANQNKLGKTDVWFPASAGTAAGGLLKQFSRWDYTATITYEKF